MVHLHVYFVWIQLLWFCWIKNSFSCFVKSKPVKQEVCCTVILPPIVSVLWRSLHKFPVNTKGWTFLTPRQWTIKLIWPSWWISKLGHNFGAKFETTLRQSFKLQKICCHLWQAFLLVIPRHNKTQATSLETKKIQLLRKLKNSWSQSHKWISE